MRGRRYSIDGEQAVASPTDTCLGLTGGTTVRPLVYDLLIGSAATPADNAIEWYIQRSTAAGTATSVTPQPLDSGDPAATTAAGEDHTAEPTYTSNAILWRLALNQRASHRWVADPDGGLLVPATSNNGLGLYPVHASFTGLVSATMHFQE
ncbi:MAG: hypothetical protein IT429_16990 [Gemmataceae bacterium]|nr:hypothetical protein [Gemmataceae bacterium]